MLDATDVEQTKWQAVLPVAPSYLFVAQDADLLAEYAKGWSLREVFAPNGDPAPGIVTTHDDFAISWTAEEAAAKVERLLATTTEAEARELFTLCSQDQWRYARAKQELADGRWRERIVPILYRPFDLRWTVYDRNVAVHRRERASENMLFPNLALCTTRATEISRGWEHVWIADGLIQHHTVSLKEVNYFFPLWIYPRETIDLLDIAPREKTANLAPEFVAALTKATGHAPSPEDTLAYIYAVLYAPSYRARYADFLKRDFPRVPLTTNPALFQQLVGIGQELIALHTMDTTLPRITRFDVAGSNEVMKVRWAPATVEAKPTATPSRPPPAAQGEETSGGAPSLSRSEGGDEPRLRSAGGRSCGEERPEGRTGWGGVALGRVYINDTQYFDDVPQPVWDMHIGGYRVAEKWLKDRKGRQLGYDDLTHYQAVIAALARTLQLQSYLDAAIDTAGGWPLR